MKELIEIMCKALVDNPDDLKVNQIDGEHTSIIELRAHQSDLGKIIGKHGRTAQAIRVILAAVGMKQKRRFNFEIIDQYNDNEAKEKSE